MRDEEIDKALTVSADEIEPSSGFTASVMEAVRADAATPPPILFPWRRVLPSLVLGAAGLLWALLEIVRQSFQPGFASVQLPAEISLWLLPVASALAWTVAGLFVSALALSVSARLASMRHPTFGG